MQPRGLPAVSVSVSIEETSSSETSYDSMMQCLKSPTAVCLKAHKLTAASSSHFALGRRSLRQNVAMCKHGGQPRAGYLKTLALFKSKTDKGQSDAK